MDTKELTEIKKTIEKMNKSNQIEILKILKKNPNIKLNENKSGVFVNITYLSEEIVNDIKQHICYIDEQEKCLEQMEYQKKEIGDTFFVEN